jgi:uncharacterized integral membrane protein
MGRLITTIVLMLAVCVLVVLNLDHKTSVNLFWVTFQDTSVVVVGLVSFVVGVVYSFFLYAGRRFASYRKSSLASRRLAVSQREKEAAAREKETAPAVETAPPDAPRAGAGGLASLLRRKGRR